MLRNEWNRFWRRLPRAGRGLAGLATLTVIAWIGALAFPSRTLVQVVMTDNGAVGRINDAKMSVTVPAPAGGASEHFGWYVAGPADSLYYQPADDSAPLAALGYVGEWLQTLRPPARWEFLPAPPEAGGAPAPTNWHLLYGTSAATGSVAAVDPTTQTAPKAHLYGELVAGQVSAGLFVQTDAAGNGYAFIVRPERRAISWWQVVHGVPTTDLSDDSYRPAFWASVADLVQEAALALTAALALAILALLLGLIVRYLGFSIFDFGSSSLRRQNPRSQIQTLLPWIFGLAGVVAAAATCLGPLEGIPHVQDDVAYLWQAKIFALGHASVPAPPYKEFFDQGFILITDGRWFTKYPPGWPLLLVPGVWAGVPWLINPLCAGASLALIYATGRRLYGPAAGFWAAALGLTSPFLLFMSGSFMSHPSTMLGGAAALYCFVRLKTDDRRQTTDDSEQSNSGQQVEDGAQVASGSARGSESDPGLSPPQPDPRPQTADHRPRTLYSAIRNRQSAILSLLVGFCLAWAFISREATAVGVAAPFVVWALADGIGAIWAWACRRVPGRATIGRLTPYLLMVVGALPPLVILGVINQALLGSPFELAQTLVGSYDRLGFGPGFGPEEAGHTPALGLYNALVYLRTLKDVLFGWPPPLAFAPLVLALAATPGRAWRQARWDLFLLGGFLGLAGIYFAWWSATTVFGPRYWYEGLPFLLLLSGRGVALLGEYATGMLRRAGAAPDAEPRRLASLAPGLVPVLLAGTLVVYNLAQVMPGQVREYTGYNDVDASSLRRVAAAHLTNAIVYVALQPDYPRRDYGKVFFANDPLLQGPIIYVRDLGPHNVALFQAFPGRKPYYLPLNGPLKPGTSP